MGEAGQTERAGGARDPDAEQHKSPLESVALRRDSGDQREDEAETRTDDCGASQVAPDRLEAESIEALADLQPIGGAMERERQERGRERDRVERRPQASAGDAQHRSRRDRRAIEISSQLRERSVLLANEDGLEVRRKRLAAAGPSRPAQLRRRRIEENHAAALKTRTGTLLARSLASPRRERKVRAVNRFFMPRLKIDHSRGRRPGS